VQELAKAKYGKSGVVAYYVMTSAPTHDKTVSFFEKHAFFGLDPKNVMFFQQVEYKAPLTRLLLAAGVRLRMHA
jgi:UDP-N-acetylglucosamine pyrophosphorylase